MTYSRPGNRSLNIRAADPSGNDPLVQLNKGSTVSTNGAQRDNVRPDLIYKNGMDKAKQIGEFMDFFNDTVKPVITEEIDRRAQVEMGEALDQSGLTPAEIVSGTTPEGVDIYRDLSPLAQNNLREARNINAIYSYQGKLTAAYESSSVLSGVTGNSPEAKEKRAMEMARLRAQAQEASGLSNVSPYALAKNSAEIAKIEGVSSNAAYKKRLSAESMLARAASTDAGGIQLAKAWKGLSVAAADDEDGEFPLTVGLGKSLEALASTLSETEGTPGLALAVADSISKGAGRIKDPTERLAYLQAVEARMASPLIALDGTDLFSVPILSNGETMRTLMEKNLADVETLANKERTLNGIRQLTELATQGSPDPAAYTGLKNQLLREATSLEEIRAILSIAPQLNKPTEAQLRNRFSIEQRIAKGESRKSLVGEVAQGVIDGTYSNEYGLSFMKGAQSDSGISPSARRAGEIYRQGYGNAAEKNLNKGAEDEVRASVNGSEAAKDAAVASFWNDVEYEINNLIEKGETDPSRLFDAARNIAITKNRERAKPKEGAAAAAAQKSPQQKLQNYEAMAQEAILNASRAAGGEVTIPSSAIDVSVLKDWQSKNPGIVFEELPLNKQQELLYQSIEKYTSEDPEAANSARSRTSKILKGARADIYKPDVEPVYNRRGKLKSGQRRRVLPQPETPRGIWTYDGRGRRKKWVPSERVPTVQEQSSSLQNTSVAETVAVLDKVSELGTDGSSSDEVRNWYNNNGFGPGAVNIVGNFLNMVTGASPATAGNIDFATPESLTALHQSWEFGTDGLRTKPLPQVSAASEARVVPTAVGNDRHEFFVLIGVSEGTRTPAGGYTKAYYGHSDPGDTHHNRGTVSGGRVSGASPEMVDLRWMGRLTTVQQNMRPLLIVMGLQPGTQGFNRVMFNMLDLEVQSPKARQGFVGKLFEMKKNNWTIESIAKARADSFINPATGNLEARGFGNSYQALFKDQRSRAGVYDYRRRV